MHNGVVIAGTCESVNVMEFRWNIYIMTIDSLSTLFFSVLSF